MRDKTIRTTGATIVLLLVAVAGLAQLQPTEDLATVSIEPDQTGSEPSDGSTGQAPVEPFVYRVGVLSGVTTDNFWAFYGQSHSVWDAFMLGPTKPALYTLDPVSGATRPELALHDVKPTFDKDGWRARVTLSDGFEWSDGVPITADDVVFTYETVKRLGLGGSWALSYPAGIESMHADSPAELRIEFSERPTLGIWPSAVGLAPIMPSHVWEPLIAGIDTAGLYGLPGSVDVGGGPLVIGSVADEKVVSHANPGYAFRDGPDQVEYYVFTDETAAVAALQDGDIDSVLSPKGLTNEQLSVVETSPVIQIASSPANGVRYLGFNLAREPMSDIAFRRALALLLDRSGLAESASEAVADSFITADNEMWFDSAAAETNGQLYTGDLATRLATAMESLRSAGYTWASEPSVDGDAIIPGTGLLVRGRPPAIVTILTPGDAYDPSRPLYAAQIAETLGWLGFEARPVETDFDTVVDLAFTRGEDGAMHYDMYLLGWSLGNPWLPGFYRALFAPDGVQNNTGYTSARFAEQLSEYEGSYSIESARKALWSMERILTEDLPYLLLYTSSITEVFRSDRVRFDIERALGGIQGRLGGIADVRPVEEPLGGTLAG